MTFPIYDNSVLPCMSFPFGNIHTRSKRYLGNKALTGKVFASVVMVMDTDGAMDALHAFWKDDCNYGLEAFVFTAPLFGLTDSEYYGMFTGDFAPTKDDKGIWTIKMDITILAPVTTSNGRPHNVANNVIEYTPFIAPNTLSFSVNLVSASDLDGTLTVPIKIDINAGLSSIGELDATLTVPTKLDLNANLDSTSTLASTVAIPGQIALSANLDSTSILGATIASTSKIDISVNLDSTSTLTALILPNNEVSLSADIDSISTLIATISLAPLEAPIYLMTEPLNIVDSYYYLNNTSAGGVTYDGKLMTSGGAAWNPNGAYPEDGTLDLTGGFKVDTQWTPPATSVWSLPFVYNVVDGVSFDIVIIDYLGNDTTNVWYGDQDNVPTLIPINESLIYTPTTTAYILYEDPLVPIIPICVMSTVPEILDELPHEITLTFNTEPSGLAIGDFSYDTINGTLDNLTQTANPKVWTMDYTANTDITDPTNTITLNGSSGAYEDAWGNPSTADTVSNNFAITSAGSGYGPEMITNGEFEFGIENWEEIDPSMSLSWNSTPQTLTATASQSYETAFWPAPNNIITVEASTEYSFTSTAVNSDGTRHRMLLGWSGNYSDEYYAPIYDATLKTYTTTFTTGASTNLYLLIGVENAGWVEWDNISLRKVL